MPIIMEQWISEELSKILDFEIPDDMIKYVMSTQNEAELHDHMNTLLDFKNPQHKNFFFELSRRKFPPRGNTLPKQQKKKISKNKQGQDFVSTKIQSESTAEPKGKGKKTKYVNLYSQEGKNAQVIMLKGRHHCDCQASKHDLVNNCQKCGRIVCTQEGSGPCVFCGNLVCTPGEQKELNAKTKSSAKLMQSLMDQARPEGWEQALLHRNRLLEYDRTSERRTKVTDDDSDYFNAGSVWLSATEKDKLEKYQQSLHEKKHASRLSKKMTFDFGGRQIVEDNTIEDVDEEEIRRITSGNREFSGGSYHQMLVGVPTDRDVAPGVNAPLLQYDPSVEENSYATLTPSSTQNVVSRIQDQELQEMSDTGKCLSMHQPWASLLIEGIKLHEGRTWYTNHRGRLWIASTAKPPDHQLIQAIENQHRVLYPDKQIKFPSFYPTGCLLGCVNVDDCLPQEEYIKRYPDGDSDSPYVFICTNPISLRLRFPIKGQHKIYQLDKTIHQAAVKCIQKMGKMEAEASAA